MNFFFHQCFKFRFSRGVYRAFFRRNSVFLVGIFASAFAFEMAFDTATDRWWDRMNKDVCIEDFLIKSSINSYDYLFFGPDELSKINTDSIDIIKRYGQTDNILAKPKHPLDLSRVCFLQKLDFETSKEKAYSWRGPSR